MYPQQTAILLSCVGVLVLALMLRAREAMQRACVRNVKSEEREMLRRACRDTERLNNELAMALRSARRVAAPPVEIQRLPVRVPASVSKLSPEALRRVSENVRGQGIKPPAKKKAPKAR